MVKLTDHLHMTIAVDWDVKPPTKQIKYARNVQNEKNCGVQ